MKAAERLALELLESPMTIEEICDFLDVSKTRAKDLIVDMRRDVLPELGAWCPRPTYDHGYVYAVYDMEPDDSGTDITERGAEAMVADNKARLQTMIKTATPYANALDKRTLIGRKADLVAKSAEAALVALALNDPAIDR